MAKNTEGAKQLFSESSIDFGYNKMADWATDVIETNKRPTMLVGPMQGALLVLAGVVVRIQAPCCYRMVDVGLYDAKNEAGKGVTFDYWPITEQHLKTYDFIVVDDVAESFRTYVAMRERLAARGSSVKSAVIVDKPTDKRVSGLSPDFSLYSVKPDDWLVGEGMNSGKDVAGEEWRTVRGVWAVKQ